MKKIIIVLLAVFSVAATAGEAQSFDVNGLKIIFKQNSATDIIAAQMYFRGGTTVLNNRLAGIEGFALQVARKATTNFPKEKMNAALESMNTRISSSSTMDYSNLSMLCVKDNFERSWDIFSDILLNPSFESDDVELVREQILANIKQSKDNPDAYLRNLIRKAFYLDHPYEIDVTGTMESVSGFSGGELKSYLKGRVTASDMLLVVVGNTTVAELRELVEKSFGELPKGNYRPVLPPAVQHDVPSLKIVKRELPTNYIQGYFPAPAFGSEESYAMSIAGSILRDRLFEEVRTKRNLSYAPSGGYGGSFSNYGYIYVTAVEPDTTIKVMQAELKRLQDEMISEKELKDKISVFITRYYLGNETNQSQASLLARYELSGAGYETAEKFIGNLRKVSAKEVQKVCKKYIHNLQFVLIGNPPKLNTAAFLM